MFCPNCGNKLSDDAKFCNGCGQEIFRSQDVTNNHQLERKVQSFNQAMTIIDTETPKVRNPRKVHFSDELNKDNIVLKTSEPFSNEIQNLNWIIVIPIFIGLVLGLVEMTDIVPLMFLIGIFVWLLVRTIAVWAYTAIYNKIAFYLPYEMTIEEFEIMARRALNPAETLIDTDQKTGIMEITYKGLVFEFIRKGDVFHVHWRVAGAKALARNVNFVYMNRAVSSISYLVYQIQQEIFKNDAVSRVYYTNIPGKYKKAKAKLPTILCRGLAIILGAIVLISLAWEEIKEITDYTSNTNSNVSSVLQSENEYVIAVKNGSPFAYPDKTYGEAFESFFGSPKWEYFLGTKEGLDENNDGVPDSTEENVDIVEFTGYCTYQDVEVKALLQFTLSREDDTFVATYLSFNEVPQNNLMLAALLDAVFTNGELELPSDNNTANMNENTNETVDYYTCYQPILSDIPKSAVRFLYCLYDLDNDGIMELIVENEEVAGGFLADIYTIENNQPIFLSNEHVCYASFYETEDRNGLYISYGHMGYEYVYRMTKQGHSINIQTAWTIEAGGLMDYYENDHPILKCDIYDSSLLRNPPSANPNPVTVEESHNYVFRTSSCQYLTELDLMGLDAFTCKIARNEIYARYGRLFTDPELQTYFNGKSWYFGHVEPNEFDDSRLNEYERANLDLIIQYESNNGYR